MSRRAQWILLAVTIAASIPLIVKNEHVRAAHHLPTILSTLSQR